MCEVLAQIQWGVLLLNLLTMSRPKVDREGMALHVGIGPTHLGTWILKPESWGTKLPWLRKKHQQIQQQSQEEFRPFSVDYQFFFF